MAAVTWSQELREKIEVEREVGQGQRHHRLEISATGKLINRPMGNASNIGRLFYDNEMAGSFFAALKNRHAHRTQYPTREHTRQDVVG